MAPNSCETTDVCAPACAPVCPPLCAPEPCGEPCKDPGSLGVVTLDPCGVEMCRIFGKHDAPYHRDINEIQKKKHKHKYQQELELPIGIAYSSTVVKSDAKSSNSEAQRFATILKAFAKVYLVPEWKWTGDVIDSVLAEGDLLFADSKDNEAEDDDENNSKEIYTEAELQVKREFDMDGLIFRVELGDKFELNETYPLGRRPSRGIIDDEEDCEEEECPETVLLLPDLPLAEFKSHVTAFYRKYKYGLIKVKNQYLLVWHALGVFFVLDLYGRNLTDFKRDSEAGVAVLFCLKNLNNVIFLIKNLSSVQQEDQFNIREIKMVRLTTPDGVTYSRDYGIRASQFEIINWDYAFLRSNLHLTLNSADALRNRSALPVGIAAILASKIDHPATWNKKMLDKIICYGVNLCTSCWISCLDKNDPIDLDVFPNKIKMGQFWITYQINPMKYEGLWKCVSNYEGGELWVALKTAFENGDDKLLLQISNQMYAIWRKGTYYYVFDPYRHRIVGHILLDNEDPKSATLRMFCTFKTFMDVLNNILLLNTKTSRFYLHTIKVKKISLERNEKPGNKGDGDVGNDLLEAQSINENICFEEDQNKCLDLAIISDFEEEEEEIPISEYEEEEMPGEEEEGGAETVEKVKLIEEQGGDDDGSGKNKKRRKQKKSKSKNKKRNKSKDGKIRREKKDKVEGLETEKAAGLDDQKLKDLKLKKPIKKVKKDEGKKSEKSDGDKSKKDRKLSGDMDARRRRLLDLDDLTSNKKKLTCGYDDDDDEKTDKCQLAAEKERGYGTTAHDMVVVGSESGTYESICSLLRSAFKCADRVLCMTPWGNYVVFRGWNYTQKIYFLFDGCTCNVNRFRYLDISSGASGLMSFSSLHDVISYMIDCQQMRTCIQENRERLVDDICRQYAV